MCKIVEGLKRSSAEGILSSSSHTMGVESTRLVALLLFVSLLAAHPLEGSKESFWGATRNAGALRPRTLAPPFTANAVVQEEFKQLSLEDYKDKWLVLLFYPFDFTFVCPTEVSSK